MDITMGKYKEDKKEKPKEDKLSKAKFVRPYYIWEGGKKTHMKFIQLAIQEEDLFIG